MIEILMIVGMFIGMAVGGIALASEARLPRWFLMMGALGVLGPIYLWMWGIR